LVHAVAAHPLNLLVGAHLLTVEGLSAVAVALVAVCLLLAKRHPVLSLAVTMRLLASDHALLLTVEARPRLLALLTLGVLLMLRPHHRIATMAAAAAASLGLHAERGPTVAVASAATPIGLHPLASAAAAALGLGSLAAASSVTLCDGAAAIAVAATRAAAMRSRSCRGCDRQRGDAGGEENPGHNILSFERKNGPFAAPFQRLNGWNLRPSALA
jgi:hypothetical protein